MGDKIKGYFFKAKSKLNDMKDKIKDRQADKDQENFMQQQIEKEKLKAVAIEQELQAKKNPPVKTKKVTDDAVEMQIEAQVNAKMDKWGQSRNLPDWAIKKMKEQFIAEQRASIYRNELEEIKEEVLNKYATKHWIVSGKLPPKMREDDLISTPYPFAKSQISLSDLKKGAKREKPVLILKTIKSEGGETVLTKETKIVKSTPPPAPTVKTKKLKAKSSKSEKLPIKTVKEVEIKTPATKKQATEEPPPDTEPYFGTAPAPSEANLPRGDGGDFEKNMENKGSMGQMIKFLFEEEKPEDKDKKSPSDQKSPAEAGRSMTSDEDESYCDDVTEMNTMMNRALTQLGPGDKSPSEIRMKTAGKGVDEKNLKVKITPPDRIRLKFKEDVVYREYWYAHEEETDKKKSLKPSAT